MITLVTGCSLFSPIKPQNEYVYRIDKSAHTAYNRSNLVTILVTEPSIDPIYNSTKMMYSKKPYQIAYFAKNRWAESPANMIQPLITQSLLNSHAFKTVVSGPFVGNFDFILNTQILMLQQDFTQNPSVIRLSMRAQIIQGIDYRVVSEKQFSIVMPCIENNPYGGVIASNHATQRLLEQLTRYTVQHTRYKPVKPVQPKKTTKVSITTN
jgi:cholesterol transport system auxiliary component